MKFTQKIVDRLKATDQRQTFRDATQVGFGLRIEALGISGRKSYFFNAHIGGHVVHKALGEASEISVAEARDKAREWREKARAWKRAGFPATDNPFKPKTARSAAPRFSQLVEHYIEQHLHDPKAKINHPAKAEKILRSVLKKYFATWMALPVDTIRIEDVLQLRSSAGEHHYQANRMVQTARILLSWCDKTKDGKINVWPLPVNVASKVELFPEQERERFLSPSELLALHQALEDPRTPRDVSDFVRLALATAARKENILSMRWADVDRDLRDWHVGLSKSGERYHVTLSVTALHLLEQRREIIPASSEYVFPSRFGTRGFRHIDKPFMQLVERAGIPNFRVHDLRRTAASYMALAGISIQKISKALGQTTLSNTEIYARLSQQAESEAREAGETKMAGMMEQAKQRQQKLLKMPESAEKNAIGSY